MDKTIWQHIATPLFLVILFVVAMFAVVKMTVNIQNPPKLVVKGSTNFTTTSDKVVIAGIADPKATLSVESTRVPLDKEGNFTYTVVANEGEQKINFVLEKWYSRNSKTIIVKKEIAQEVAKAPIQNISISKDALSESGPLCGLLGVLGLTAIIVAMIIYVEALNVNNKNFAYRPFTKS